MIAPIDKGFGHPSAFLQKEPKVTASLPLTGQRWKLETINLYLDCLEASWGTNGFSWHVLGGYGVTKLFNTKALASVYTPALLIEHLPFGVCSLVLPNGLETLGL